MRRNMRQNQSSKVIVVVAVALVIVFLLWPGGSLAPQMCPTTGARYGLMFDAGSTGSRVHVFEFDYHPSGTIALKDELFKETKPGLSAFKDSPQEAAASLKPLLEAAIARVPPEMRRCTPIELKATAGLRLLGEEASRDILRAVLDLFYASPFHVKGDDSVIIMDGKDEGPYAWITVNFLLDAFQSATSKTAAIVDMGGASTQIVFKPDADRTMASVDKTQTYEVDLEGYRSAVYTHSHLNYGLKEAGVQMFRAAPDSKSFPCLPKGTSATLNDLTVANGNGPQSFESCLAIANGILKKTAKCDAESCSFNSVPQPLLSATFSGPLYVFSYYYDRMQFFIDESGETTVGGLRKAAEGVCGGQVAGYAEHNKGTMCMDLTYLYAVMHTGYDLPDSTPLHIKKKIKGIETAWALGAMMIAMKPKV